MLAFLVTTIAFAMVLHYAYYASPWYRIRNTKSVLNYPQSGTLSQSDIMRGDTLKVLNKLTWRGTREPIITYASITSVTLNGSRRYNVKACWVQNRQQVTRFDFFEQGQVVWSLPVVAADISIRPDLIRYVIVRDFAPASVPAIVRDKALYEGRKQLAIVAVGASDLRSTPVNMRVHEYY
jgi:hypothetical protein